MSRLRNHHIYTTVLLIGMSLCLAACGTLGEQCVKSTTASIDDAQAALVQARAQIDTTMGKLDLLMTKSDPNLRFEYDQFVRQVDESIKNKNLLFDRLYDLRSEGKVYFQVWEKELKSFRNEDIREQCERRRNVALDNYRQMTDAVQSSVDCYKMLLADLRDIQRYLDIDLTPGGIEAISETVDKSTRDSALVLEVIDIALNKVNRMSADLSARNGHAVEEEGQLAANK